MNKNRTYRPLRAACASLLLVGLAAAAGCSRFDFDAKIPWFGGKDDKPSVPTKVVVVWKDAVLRRSDQSPMRGFGGRLMFYNAKSQNPIRVDGQLVVYAFDEQGRSPAEAKPDRKYVFTREQFDKHYSKSEIGHSYSVWLPWDEAGGPQKQVSLIARFTPNEGQMVASEQTSAVLPGNTMLTQLGPRKTAPQTDGQLSEQGSVRPAAYDAAVYPPTQPQADAQPPRRMDTHTIPLPPRFGRTQPIAVVQREPAARRISEPRQPATDQSATVAANPQREPAKRPQMVASQPAQPLPQRSTRFAPAGYRAPSGLVARPTLDRAPSPLPPVE